MNIILELKLDSCYTRYWCATFNSILQIDIEDALFGGGDVITKEAGYDMCIAKDGTSYIVTATNGDKTLTMTANGTWTGK